ncbi:MAG: MBL fold metallo-hydrolase [Acidobacteriota bacterium]|nr:MBL fold metallo-hydrolase [Acidobacteriota bacterium]MDH3528216.1 MBL fold metallo-hydrolase [Acidobacteriota bacterium]
MIKTITILCLIFFCPAIGLPKDPYVLILGTAQDAGVPQIGCMSPFCQKVWKDLKKRQKVSSIALVDPDSGSRWIFDATPDLPAQFQLLKEHTEDHSNKLDGIFLTHAHIGHYTGLMYLGRESMNAGMVPVYAMPRMRNLLARNAPWSQLISLKNIEIRSLARDTKLDLSGGISVTAFEVPHRDEFSETVGFRIDSGSKALIFIPDIDKWSKWDKKLAEIVAANDYVLVDGTFYADGEIPRPISEVPHPFVSETAELLKSLTSEQKAKVHFIHFNHSNPLIQGNKEKLKELKTLGFRIAYEGLVLDL